MVAGVNAVVESMSPEDAARYPGLTAAGAQMLQRMREHPHAPIFRNASGHRLLPDELPAIHAFAAQVRRAEVDPRADLTQPWLRERIAHALARVPCFRRYGSPPERLADLPTVTRGDLARDIAAFVPDDQALDRLINFRTTGLTGQPLLIASHPVVAARYLAFHERALARFGIELSSGPGDVGVMLVGWQQRCFTYVSVTPQRGECGLAKINLHADDWRDPADRGPYIDAMQPEVITGDPLSLAALLAIAFAHRPRAIMSTSMALLPGLRAALAQRFDCPVLDLYSLNEAGPIAVFDPALDAHVLLQPEMAIEIVNAEGDPLPEGERGEITLTGGFNFCLPLLRYRTGDHASLQRRGGEWVLADLAGRAPVRFRSGSGAWINNIDVTHALKPFALPQYALLQRADGSLEFAVHGFHSTDLGAVKSALQSLVGADVPLQIEVHPEPCDKVIQYRSELAGGAVGDR
jgi:phenylacetate-CoA ligase